MARGYYTSIVVVGKLACARSGFVARVRGPPGYKPGSSVGIVIVGKLLKSNLTDREGGV